ncbi:hypothetical protein GUJ93_ZPchr0007g4615 [Zizania palustris]|uniref:Uncharacterized protein n=1 Tax=Zizania palustris TaxID=103762 RepID=A0A8J5TED4_ZIZPA|nr:hypothetical protein GUJ93_ZPchr0007g4615 [Zizania palustris]
MLLPLVKLGSLAFRTLSKPIAALLKHNAGVHPKFRWFINHHRPPTVRFQSCRDLEFCMTKCSVEKYEEAEELVA